MVVPLTSQLGWAHVVCDSAPTISDSICMGSLGAVVSVISHAGKESSHSSLCMYMVREAEHPEDWQAGSVRR